MNQSFDMDAVEHFTVGAIGEPGSRLFLMQFQQGTVLATLKVEKQQVSALCSYLGELLADSPSPGHLPEDMALRTPLDIDWVAGALGASYDEVADRITFLIEEAGLSELESESIDTNASARCMVTREQAAAFAIHGTSLVESGRPPCPLCGHPLDPSGHACPRTNGHRPPSL